jgi:hypothetical protein
MGSRLWAESKFSSMGVEYYANAVFLPIQKRNGVVFSQSPGLTQERPVEEACFFPSPAL